ncbi:hypothetical protein M8J76_005377 [Diaphorina citri]|nr:hypothetical protein M8J75_015555 [Diaphorina citri]KAI5729686.1 hypothetical protein M8J76_005377 [Diaphorina citri]
MLCRQAVSAAWLAGLVLLPLVSLMRLYGLVPVSMLSRPGPRAFSHVALRPCPVSMLSSPGPRAFFSSPLPCSSAALPSLHAE